MPLLKIQSNTTARKTNDEILKEATKQMAKWLGKPENFVMVRLETGIALAMAGETTPAVLVELKSIMLPDDRTRELAEKITTFLSELFDVPAERVFITFDSYDRHMWGWNGATFDR